jgi:hypothetical protein
MTVRREFYQSVSQSSSKSFTWSVCLLVNQSDGQLLVSWL